MQKDDFVKISYTGKIKEGEQIFDKADGVQIIVGEGFVIPGVDEALLQMKAGEKKTIEVEPAKAFGDRNPDLMKLVPESEFRKRDIEPRVGMPVDADNARGRVVSVASGRVRVDFNHPLAGKVLIYDLEVKEKIEKPEEKIRGLVNFYSKLEVEKVSVALNGKDAEISVPPVIHPAYKKRIADEIRKFLGFDRTKFVEIFDSKTGEQTA